MWQFWLLHFSRLCWRIGLGKSSANAFAALHSGITYERHMLLHRTLPAPHHHPRRSCWRSHYNWSRIPATEDIINSSTASRHHCFSLSYSKEFLTQWHNANGINDALCFVWLAVVRCPYIGSNWVTRKFFNSSWIRQFLYTDAAAMETGANDIGSSCTPSITSGSGQVNNAQPLCNSVRFSIRVALVKINPTMSFRSLRTNQFEHINSCNVRTQFTCVSAENAFIWNQ